MSFWAAPQTEPPRQFYNAPSRYTVVGWLVVPRVDLREESFSFIYRFPHVILQARNFLPGICFPHFLYLHVQRDLKE